jgi:predicted TIM-barrel fold metal-dependent hydrolase
MAEAGGMALELLERHRDATLRLRPESCRVWDAHTHLGVDVDGHALAPAQLLRSMDEGRVAGALVFPLDEPDQHPAYRAPNDRVLAWASASDGRLVPFARLRLDEEPVVEAERCLANGARGIKLHPRAQEFRVDDPRLEAVFTVAAEHRVPVLIHAGRGLPPGMAQEVAHVADRHPEAALILAHAAIAEQGRIGELANGHPNIFFDTSTWTPLDLLALFSLVGPEQVVYASDVPYGRHLSSQFLLLRMLRRLSLDEDVVRGIMGGTVELLLAGERPPRVSAPVATTTLQVSYARARVHTYIAAAMPMLWLGQRDLVGFTGLARAAAADADGALDHVAELIAAAELLWLEATGSDEQGLLDRRRGDAFTLLNAAQAEALYA